MAVAHVVWINLKKKKKKKGETKTLKWIEVPLLLFKTFANFYLFNLNPVSALSIIIAMQLIVKPSLNMSDGEVN